MDEFPELRGLSARDIGFKLRQHAELHKQLREMAEDLKKSPHYQHIGFAISSLLFAYGADPAPYALVESS